MIKLTVILFSLITFGAAYAEENGPGASTPIMCPCPKAGIPLNKGPAKGGNVETTNPNEQQNNDMNPDNVGVGNGGATKSIGTDNGGGNGPTH